jgi:exonuclease III
MPEIAMALLEHAADVIVLTEVRRTTGGQIAAVLADHGWTSSHWTDPPLGKNGMLVAARSPIRVPVTDPPAPDFPHRWIEADLPEIGLSVVGVHVPDDSRRTDKKAFWKGLLSVARERRDTPLVIIGDFNTGRHRIDEKGATFACTASMGTLASLGYIDTWRHLHPDEREFSWYSHGGNGFRIDHAFIAPPLHDRLASAWFSHEQRIAGLSDHSPLLVGLV